MENPRIHQNARAVFRRIQEGQGAVLLHLDSGEYRQVNEMGAVIWELLSASPRRDDLVEQLRLRVENPPEGIVTEIDAFIESLRERGLVTLEVVDAPLAD